MGKVLENYKNNSIDKIRIGSCIELLLLLDSFNSDFSRLNDYINSNVSLFNNQILGTILNNFDSIKDVLTNSVDILLNDIDNKEVYCQYLERFY